MENFTPLSAALGGCLIGLSATLLLAGIGRIAGMTGIIAGAFQSDDTNWRRYFLFGALAAGIAAYAAFPHAFYNDGSTSRTTLIIAGLLVGFGTRLGSGCTSGHGVCGLPRFSVRSLVAVCTFMFTGGVTIVLIRILQGAGS